MKKRFFLLAILTLTGAIFSACEKDDICPEGSGTTPYLHIGFFDITDQDVPKSVTRLRAVGLGQNITVGTFSDRTSQNEITLPLKNYENATSFYLINDSADDANGVETGDVDLVEFNYQTNEVFISRGCGYAVNYILNQVVNDPEGVDSSQWIRALEVVKSSVQPQDTLHVKIYH
ncbi:DUF6452 family protein [Robertkochia sediminum]|uniref:DUF6452 family protein n=1 Tax=Robertkochia sediminum TaxID=2785326 RepID=UPI0019314835|nr:DUF6452 family protein [Robertkochia sediminum]MBL7472094.1 hypothetical protein [Robertkochia sediminum]